MPLARESLNIFLFKYTLRLKFLSHLYSPISIKSQEIPYSQPLEWLGRCGGGPLCSAETRQASRRVPLHRAQCGQCCGFVGWLWDRRQLWESRYVLAFWNRGLIGVEACLRSTLCSMKSILFFSLVSASEQLHWTHCVCLPYISSFLTLIVANPYPTLAGPIDVQVFNSELVLRAQINMEQTIQ